MTTDLDRTFINGVVVDYRNGYTGNHPPRIRAFPRFLARAHPYECVLLLHGL